LAGDEDRRVIPFRVDRGKSVCCVQVGDGTPSVLAAKTQRLEDTDPKKTARILAMWAKGIRLGAWW
jgi:hypothetical protein